MNNKKIEWIDNLRVIATFFVIVLHVSSPLLHQYGKLSAFKWDVANFYDSLSRFCVPIFVMISGALLLNRDYKLNEYLKKRFLRIIYPLVFWSLCYLFYEYVILNPVSIKQIDTQFYIKLFAKLKYGVSFHFWFVYLIIGLYLLIPILSVWIKNAPKNHVSYFLIIWLITVILNHPFKINNSFELSFFTGYIGYLVLGYHLRTLQFTKYRNNFIILGLLFLTTFSITFFGTRLFSEYNNRFYGGFYENLSVHIILFSISVFLIVKNFSSIKNKYLIAFRNIISKYSYGIYLVHILVLYVFNYIGFTFEVLNPLASILIISFSCLVFSCLVIWIINKIPIVGKYISG